MFLNPSDRDYLAKIDNLNRALQQSNNALNPTFQSLAVTGAVQTGNGVFNQAATGNQIIQTSTNSRNIALGMWAGGAPMLYSTATLGIITDITSVPSGAGDVPSGGSYAATFSKNKIEMFSPVQVNATLFVKGQADCLRLADDAAYMSFYSSQNVRSGLIQIVSGSFMRVMPEANHNLRLGSNGSDQIVVDLNGNVYPLTDGIKYNGLASLRWAAVYAATGAIQTSDARKKTPVTALTPAMRAAAREMLPMIGTYQWLDSVKEKGVDKARLHVGFTVQQAIAILEKHGIDPFRMAFICHDKWDAEYENRCINEGEKVTKLRIVQKQKTRIVEQPQDVVELIAGKPVLVHKVVEVAEPVFEELPVQREDGSLVMLDEHTPMLHRVPVMETVQEPYEAEAEPKYEKVLVREAGDCFAFRYDQLTLFMLSALAE